MRRRGIFGYNIPPQTGGGVLPADYNIVGVIGRFARGIASLVEINNTTDMDVKLGGNFSGFFGRYVLDSLFKNAKGQPTKLWVNPYVAPDAAQATLTINDQATPTPVATMTAKAGYAGTVDKSLDGNSTGITLTNGTRFATTIASNASLSATSIVVASVSGIVVGDLLKITSTGPVTHYAKVSAINEATKTLTVSALTNAVVTADSVSCMGFQIVTYRKNNFGIYSKVQLNENSIWLSMEPENTQYYINNAFANHPYLILNDSASATTPIQLTWPADIATVTFLASGANGTSPSTNTDWSTNAPYTRFDTKPIRWLFNTETTLSSVNIDGEAYCTGRLDTPIWMYNIPQLQTKAQLQTIGQSYQRSNQVQGVISASFRNVSDPIGVGANPVLAIPTHGAIVGSWIQAFYTAGFHRVPAGMDFPLSGFVDTPNATEDTFTEDDRTDILSSGVNLVQFVPGKGLLVRSFRTPSTNIGSLWGHYLVMQNFIKISAVESDYAAENRLNRITQIKARGEKLKDFGRKLYEGSYPFGIDKEGAFGNFIKQDGSLSVFDDVFIVQADQFNNPQSQINIGEANLKVQFYPPPILESEAIMVGVFIPG